MIVRDFTDDGSVLAKRMAISSQPGHDVHPRSREGRGSFAFVRHKKWIQPENLTRAFDFLG